jgi:hypothetical protein
MYDSRDSADAHNETTDMFDITPFGELFPSAIFFFQFCLSMEKALSATYILVRLDRVASTFLVRDG